MAKGYWVVQVDVTDPQAYKAYVQANAEAFGKFGARFLVRGSDTSETPEGRSRARVVVLEFKDYATAVACYHSPEYTRAVALRANAATADIVIIEGYEGDQPAASP